jgi:PhnB protein
MTGFNPYITFDSCCEEALNFYKKCFGGEIVFIQYFDESAFGNGGAEKPKVMHSEFRADAVHLMACDKSPGQTIHQGTNITLYISFKNSKKQDEIFESLSVGGIIHMPLEATFWGSRLGILTDQFGIHWMLVLNRD